MTTTRKRRVTLVPADEPGDTVTPSNVATAGAEDKLMTRASKRRKLALSNTTVTSEEPTEAVKPALAVVGSEDGIKRSTKVKRQAWTSTGIVIFFEALAEHGKDFGKILNYMCAKEKKKKQRDPFIENLTKNQVRFFYYRTWHKVSSLLALGERDEESPNQKRLQKTRGVPIPPGDVPKGCGGSDEETEGETEAAFDMSLDEGEDSQDGCPDHVTPSVVNIEDGDSLLPGGQYSDPSPFADPTSQLSEHPSNIDKEAGISEEQNVFLDGAGVDDTTNDGVDIVGVVSSGVGSEVGKSEKKKMETGHSGGGMVMVNGAWQSLDLVAMICYDKMRLKCRADNKVLGRKLKEMVYKGTTTIRIKGKRRKEMKIPNCAALKSTKTSIVSSSCAGESSGAIESSPMETTPALSLTVELRPLNSSTWSYVQQLSMNPRLRLNVSSSRTVKELFHLISAKWHILPQEVFNVVKLFVAPSKQKDQSEDGTGSLLPLELDPLMTIGELNTKCGNATKAKPSKLSLQYEISSMQADSAERNIEHLLKLATVLTSSYMPQHTLNLVPPATPPNNTLTSTPTSVPLATPSNTSSLISSPVVQQYIKTLPRKSPIKSPLTKYKRMKHLRPSPLKASRQSSSMGHRIKPIQLQFPSSQATRVSPTVSKSKSKQGEQNRRTPHLVTLSQKCLSQSGSFTGLRLDDIFHSVNENLKGAQSTKPRKSSNIVIAPLSEDKEVKTVGTGPPTQSSSPATNKSTVILPRHTEGVSTHTVKASPLEQLASQVSSIPAMKQKPGASSAYQINIVTTGITTPLVSRPPAIASPTGRLATTTATKHTRRNPNSQRPVVPKPLVYLPQFAKQLASLHVPPLSQSAPNQFTQPKQQKLRSHLTTSQSTAPSINSPSTTNSLGQIHIPSSQTALNTQDLLQAQARLLHELLTKPSSQNGEDEQKRQQAVQTLLHSLVTLGSQFPALLQKLDLKALLSAAVQSKSSLGKDVPLTSIKSQGLPTSVTATSTNATSTIQMPTVTDVVPPSADSNNLLSSLQDFGSVYGTSSMIGNGQDPIYTSSDTVAELLKGLSPSNNQQTEKESVIRLSEETADVLPSFARAMIHLNTSSRRDHNNDGLTNALSSSPSDEDSSSGSADALAGILQTGGNLESISDTSFKNIVDSTDYNEVFAQLKDILRTPERSSVSKSLSSQDSDKSEGGACYSSQAKSHGEIMPSDSFSSPFKMTQQSSSSDHGLRSILEENSVDYINKFKELASAMNHTS